MILEQVQNQLECIYGIGVAERASDFLIGKNEALNYLACGEKRKIPKELFFVRQPENETLEIALFLDSKLLRNLERHNPFHALNEKNLSDFCILIEGISHFVYYLWKAYHQMPITQLEMELQAEIDKFLMLFVYLRADSQPHFNNQLFDALFADYKLLEGLSEQKQERYLTASKLASHYCHRLQQRFKNPAEMQTLISEARTFYNLSQEQKIQHILN